MKPTIPNPAASAAALANTGAIFRHDPKGSDPVFVCMAVRLETGLWASVHDRGAYGGTVHGQRRGTMQLIDLFLHTLDDAREKLPIRWATQTAIDPIMLMGIPGDRGAGPAVAPSCEMIVPEYQGVHRASLTDGGVFARRSFDASRDPKILSGRIYEMPALQPYRSLIEGRARERTTICVIADLDHPCDLDIGSGIFDDAGRLAGVLVGETLSSDRSHIGAYVPADFLAASVAIAKATAGAAMISGRHCNGIDHVEHQSSDVYWPDDEDAGEPARSLRGH